MAVRRLRQEDLDTLRRYLDRGAEPPAAVTQHLWDHLVHLSEEALRVAGPLPTDGTYDDAESAVQAFLEEKGQDAVWAALRETASPGRFASYMRAALKNFFTDVGRRQRRPRLWERTAKLLESNAGRRYTCLEHHRAKRLRWWGRRNWPAGTRRQGDPDAALLGAARKVLDGLPRVRDRRRKKYAPKILSNEALNDFVSGTMDGVGRGLKLDHYGWLFPQMFPVEYRRIDPESYDERIENLGTAGEVASPAVVGEFVDASVEARVLAAIPDTAAANRLIELRRHDGDAYAAAVALGETPEDVLGDREYMERFVRQRGMTPDDLDRVVDRLLEA